jgi:hypothetical protein
LDELDALAALEWPTGRQGAKKQTCYSSFVRVIICFALVAFLAICHLDRSRKATKAQRSIFDNFRYLPADVHLPNRDRSRPLKFGREDLKSLDSWGCATSRP